MVVKKSQPASPFQLKANAKLRMIGNANDEVNAVRAERSGQVAIQDTRLLDQVPQLRAPEPFETAAVKKQPRRGHVGDRLPTRSLVNVFVTTAGVGSIRKLPREVGRRENIVLATRVPVNRLRMITARKSVSSVEIADALKPPRPVIHASSSRKPSTTTRRVYLSNVTHGRGEVLIGVIDVGGFDFTHEDFLDRDKTRWVAIWDQGGTMRPAPSGYDYGSEITGEHMNKALQDSKQLGLPAWDIEPQSEMQEGSHGTHVASIAAGNRGVCPAANIAGVLVSLPKDDIEDRRKSFYDTTRIAQAVDYLFGLGRRLGMPVSINISLGTNGHAHDGSAAVCRWIDAALTDRGRSVCVAAGNAGQEAPQSEGDLGWTMGRIHTSGKIESPGLSRDIEWVVVGNTIEDISENELEIWYGPQDRFEVEICPPGLRWTRAVRPGEFIENKILPGGTFLSVYNELYHPASGANCISIYLSPTMSPDGVRGVRPGVWLVRLRGIEARDGRFHGWIERDDPYRAEAISAPVAWSFPSFFTRASNVDESSVSSLACGRYVVGVANLDQATNRVNVTSSQGPTRDGRLKPEIAAPGTNILAARGFSASSKPWISMSGTSMASPYVAGVIALMLATEPELTAAQIGGIIQRTARPLPGSNYNWRTDSGFGAIDPEECVREAARLKDRTDVT